MTSQPDLPTDSLRVAAQSLAAEVSGKTIVEAKEINSGVMTHKYVVATPDGERYVVRFYPATRSFVVNFEPDLLRRCRAQGMPVPEVMVDSRVGPHAPLSYVMYRMIPGRTLSDRITTLNQPALLGACRALYDALLTMSRIPVKGYGDMVDSARAKSRSWNEFVRQSFHAGLAAVRSTPLVSAESAHMLEALAGRLPSFHYFGAPTLVWGDISPDNIILDDRNRFAGMVDFEGVLAAEFALHFGYLRARYAQTPLYRAMLECVVQPEKQEIDERAAFYVVLRAIRILSHASAPLPIGISRDPIEEFLPGLRPALRDVLRRFA